MGVLRPATPGFIVTLVATGLLAAVSFCVPYIKSIFFLKATINVNNVSGVITFGTLGYCLQIQGETTCSSPSIGYQLDINSLVGNRLPVQIPQVAVKWLTYALVLHIVALVLSAASAVFGLLAHVREMSMTCCSTCVSGFAAGVALLAFIFDVALFFIARARINAVGSAEIGSAVWMTLAAWIMLFFSGCFYTLGRCCISKRKQRGDWKKGDEATPANSERMYADQMRMDAIKADAERKAQQSKPEGGLPAFHETQPLTGRVEGDGVYVDTSHQGNGAGYANGGYLQAPAGTRTVDDYYGAQNAVPNSYPPVQHHGQPSGYASSVYAPTTYSPPPPSNPYLTPQPPQHDNRYLSGNQYGHTAGGTSYHTATSHSQQPSGYSQYDSYDTAQQPYIERYNTPPVQNQYQHQPDRSYTLGGDGYGANSLPPLPSQSYPYPGGSQAAYVESPPRSPVGARPQPTHFDSAPPGYDAGSSGVTGHWGKH